MTGLRYVSEKQDQMRWRGAAMFSLRSNQDQLRVYTSGEEEYSCQKVHSDSIDDPTVLADARPRTKLIEGLEDRLNRIESFVMSDLVSDSSDMKAGDRHKGTHSTHEPNGGSNASTRCYPSRPAATPLHANNGSSRLGNDTATPCSENGVMSTSTGEAKLMDFITSDAKGQSQYIGKSRC
jgi:hypothetical protein